MMVRPLDEKRRPKPCVVIVETGPGELRAITEDGEVLEAHDRAACRALLVGLVGWQVYGAGKLTGLLAATGAQSWTGYTWKGALTRMKLDGGPQVHPCRRAVKGLDDPAAAMFAALAWLRTLGVNPGGLGAMAYRLWRLTLHRPVSLRGPKVRDALYGGRQEAPDPGQYQRARCWDLGAAYPASMAAEPYPARMIPIVAGPGMSLDGCGIARAEVRIPQADWCPLPVRVGKGALCFGWGDAEGWWPWRELRMARDAGCTVVVREAYAGMGEVDLFGPWWRLVRQGRANPTAKPVVKAITSSLWGQFALEGDGGRWVRWRDDAGRKPITVQEVRGAELPQAGAVHIASETTARVRCRLFTEGLSLPSAIYCDTDAVIVGTSDKPSPAGKAEGKWSLRAKMAVLDLRGPQVYRYLCPDCHTTDDHLPWHHIVAGAATPAMAAAMFRRSTVNVASLAPGDMTLPAGPLDRFARCAS